MQNRHGPVKIEIQKTALPLISSRCIRILKCRRSSKPPRSHARLRACSEALRITHSLRLGVVLKSFSICGIEMCCFCFDLESEICVRYLLPAWQRFTDQQPWRIVCQSQYAEIENNPLLRSTQSVCIPCFSRIPCQFNIPALIF